MSLDRYRKENAAMKIDGYFHIQCNEQPQSAFERAKAELIEVLKRDIQDCESMTLEKFQETK